MLAFGAKMRRLPAVTARRVPREPARVRSPRTIAPPDADPRIQKLVASISEERLAALVQKLAGFGTRNTLSDTTSPTRGIGAARQWIFDELTRSSPRLQVSFDTLPDSRGRAASHATSSCRTSSRCCPARVRGASTSPRTTTR